MIVHVYHHNFRDFNATPLPLEDVFRAFAAASGIHDLDVYNREQANSGDSVRMELDSGLDYLGPSTVLPDGTTSYDAPLRFLRTTSGLKRAVFTDFTLPMSATIRGVVNCPGWMIGAYETSGGYYLAGTDGNGQPCIWLYDKVRSNLTLLCTTAWLSFSEEHKFTVTFRRWQSDSQGAIGRLSICLFINNVVAASYEEEVKIQPVNSPLSIIIHPGQVRPVTFSSFEVSDFTEVMDVVSIDPGEPPMGGLSRAIEGVYLKMWMRPNKSLRAYRPFLYSTTPLYTFPMDTLESLEGPSVDVRGLRSHLRQQGAYVEAEVIDTENLRKYGYRFEQAQNPFLMTVEECYLEGKRSLRRMKEEAMNISFVTHGRPLLETEDVVILNGEKYRITTKSVNYVPGQIEEDYNLRGVIDPAIYDVSQYDGATYE